MQNCCKPGPRSSHSEIVAENIPVGSSWHKVRAPFNIAHSACASSSASSSPQTAKLHCFLRQWLYCRTVHGYGPALRCHTVQARKRATGPARTVGKG
ncbi:hypothetical protein HaLaN_04100 [Haematococcus lacustris]|uniref:Uncharacterized protein n=1 Tax=Haematococcus lacustris TaxID=44745 RepID=A0A699YG44_HAELA|nr:hypothetical protein HaLaN_04100 [Haematococcus lacustris]